MKAEALSIEGLWLFTPVLRPDDRGVFLESFKQSTFVEAVGHSLDLQQANISVSKQGTIRGVHFAQVPPGQAKYVQCMDGRILDIAVDIRAGSPTFGQHVAVELDSDKRQALYLSEGFGHAFCALSESATVNYLCSEPYAPTREFGIHPLDPALNLPWPTDIDATISPKDAGAPTLAEAQSQGLLPSYADCIAHRATLKGL